MTELKKLLQKAEKTYLANFPPTTCFERAVFFSWACQKEHCCTYCYMSTLPKGQRTRDKVRSFASLLAETLLCKKLGWQYGFLSGGVGVLDDGQLLDLISKTQSIMQQKIWVNLGILNKEQLQKFKPHIAGVVGTVEVLDPVLHKKVCPSKPIEEVAEMFRTAKKQGITCGMTLIVGLGETIKDYALLRDWIEEFDIRKIHIYGLNPQKGTAFEAAKPPTAEYQAEWIARTRIDFPEIDIQCGIWLDRADRIALLLKAGANSISKFPALRQFNSKQAKEIEKQAKLAGRRFEGTLTELPDVDWDKEVDALEFDDKLKVQIREKLGKYLKRMR